jgi:hypothetical protein
MVDDAMAKFTHLFTPVLNIGVFWLLTHLGPAAIFWRPKHL